MKKLLPSFLRVILFVAPAIFLTCCTESEDEPYVLPDIGQALNATYTNRVFPENELVLTYCGHPLSDKDVRFYTRDMKLATVELINIIPGEKVTSFTVEMNERRDEAEVYDLQVWSGMFATEDGTEITIGEMNIRRNRLEIEITDVEFLPNAMSYNNMQTGWWGLSEDPLLLEWTVKPGRYPLSSGAELVINEGENVNPGILGLLIPMVGPMLLPNVLRDIHFDTKGRITAHYSSMNETNWTLSPENNLIHYFVTKDNTLMLNANLSEIINQIGQGNATRATSADEDNELLIPGLSEELLYQLLGVLSGWFKDGIPMDITNGSDGSTNIILKSGQLDPVIKLIPILLPLFEDMIYELIPEDLGELGGLIDGALESVVVFAENTADFKVGLNLVPIAEPGTDPGTDPTPEPEPDPDPER